MLRKLVIENYKSIRKPIEIEFRPLTFLYGPNSVGKSTVLDALELLRKFIEGDPALTELISAGTRDRYVQLSDDPSDSLVVGDNECVTIALSAYVDAASLAQHNFDWNALRSVPNFSSHIADGAELGVQVIFHRHSDLKQLILEIDGQEVLRYTNDESFYDPYFMRNTLPDIVPSRKDAEWRPSVEGTFRLKRNIVATLGPFGSAFDTSSKRRQLLFEKEDEWVSIRGLKFAPFYGTDAVSVAESTSELLFPSLGEEDYINHQANIVKAYSFTYPDFDEACFKAELAKEYASNTSSLLFSELRSAARFISDFSSGILDALATELSFLRVRGNRNAIRSDRPIHLKSRVDAHYESPPGTQWSGLYEGSRYLGAAERSREENEILSAYVKDINYHSGDANASGQRDFPNFAIKTYMPSLRRYEFRKHAYIIIDRYHYENPTDDYGGEGIAGIDPHQIAASYLVYFSVGETPVGDRSFSQVGSSLGYLLPILIVLGEDRSCGIEEPELHLHPLAQEELADVFVHAKQLGRVVLIESHSELFLLKIAQRMRETWERGHNANVHLLPAQRHLSVFPDDLGIYVFSSDHKSGTEARLITMLADGSLDDDWPIGMFDASWRAVLGRLSMFSKSIDSKDVIREWPWISDVEGQDQEIARWLIKCWQLKKLGTDFVENELVTIGRIVEKALFSRLLDGLTDTLIDTKPTVGSNWQKEIDQWINNKSKMLSLWWWQQTLGYLRKSETVTEHKLLSSLRKRIKHATWRSEWESVDAARLINGLSELQRLRNPAAHGKTASVTEEEVGRVRELVYDDARPGILLCALAFARANRGEKPRPL